MENKSEVKELKADPLLPFTEEELKELNLTKEELDILEWASAYSQTVEMLPDDFDAFENKMNESFDGIEDPNMVFEKITDLCETDPDFVNEMIAFQEIMSVAKPYQEEEDSGTGK